MTKKTKCLLGIAGSMLAAGSLCATSVTNTFDEAVGGWTGDCALSTSESNYVFSAASVAGFPTGKAYPLSGNYVLTVEGVATNGVSAGSTPLVDMMVQAARPDDVLELPEEDASSVQIAVAVDSNGYFNAYCNSAGGTPDWYQITTTATDTDAWVRVSLLFDYTNGRCQIRLNGEPVKSNYGFVRETGDTTGGAWYNLARGNNASLVKVVGCTAIDEYVLNDAGQYPLVAGAATNGVSCAWLDANGLSWDTTASYDSSKKADGTTPMTVADKYKYCFGPFDGQGEADFAVKSISTTAEKVTLALPTTVANGGRKVVVDYGTDKTFGTYETTAEVTGQTTVQIDVPAPGSVTYYRLRTTDK